MIKRNEGSSQTKHRYRQLYAKGKVTMDEVTDLFDGFDARQDRKCYDEMTKGERALVFFVRLIGGRVQLSSHSADKNIITTDRRKVCRR